MEIYSLLINQHDIYNLIFP